MKPSVIALLGCLMVVSIASAVRAEEAVGSKPDWLEPMQKLNAQFKGTNNYIARFGDSITVSRAFWAPMGWSDPDPFVPKDDGLPARPKGKPWKQTIGGVNDEDGAASGWSATNVLGVIDKVLANRKPEVAIIMIGTNDIAHGFGGKGPENYRKNLESIITKCLDAKCIPIVNTIPPRKGSDASVAKVNAIVTELAKKHRVPLVDYHAEIVTRQPEGKWLGTLIDADGVHPTAGKTNDYSAENLKVSGYALRTWVNFLKVREIYFRVLEPGEVAGGK